MASNDSFQGVSKCYVFKSRLQEYAQKVGLPTPVYETIKEGPSHEPSFRSTVVVKDIRFDSLPGFFNRKAAEQSAAEVALVELSKSAAMSECISQPVHETGLCKNLLQEYAQKMNYAIPSYVCSKVEALDRVPLFSCTVDIGGIKYIGAAARTKKEAEIKAARTALLAIQATPRSNGEPTINSIFTVIPCKKKSSDLSISPQETIPALKPIKGRFKKKPWKKKKKQQADNGNGINHPKGKRATGLGLNFDNQAVGQEVAKFCGVEVVDPVGSKQEVNVSGLSFDGNVESASVPSDVDFAQRDVSYPVNMGITTGTNSMTSGVELAVLVEDVDKFSCSQTFSVSSNPILSQEEVPNCGEIAVGDGSLDTK